MNNLNQFLNFIYIYTTGFHTISIYQREINVSSGMILIVYCLSYSSDRLSMTGLALQEILQPPSNLLSLLFKLEWNLL